MEQGGGIREVLMLMLMQPLVFLHHFFSLHSFSSPHPSGSDWLPEHFPSCSFFSIPLSAMVLTGYISISISIPPPPPLSLPPSSLVLHHHYYQVVPFDFLSRKMTSSSSDSTLGGLERANNFSLYFVFV